MLFKAQQDSGILRTQEPHLVEVTWVKTLYQSTTLLCGTLVLKPIKRLQENKRESYLTTSNIYVVSDSKNPDNEGKVFLFRYGKKIFDKLMKANATRV